MITLGIVLLIVGFIAKVAILWTIGIVLLVVGAVLVCSAPWGGRSAVDGTTTEFAI